MIASMTFGTITLFASSLLDLLQTGRFAFLTCLGFILIRERKHLFPLVGLIFVIYLASINVHVVRWDEFSHWAFIQKHFDFFHRLPGNSDGLNNNTYIPGIPLLAYALRIPFITGDQRYFLSYSLIFLLSCFVFSQESLLKVRRSGFGLLSLFLSFLVALRVSHLGFFQLYVDSFLGFFWGLGVLSLFLLRESRVFIWGIFCVSLLTRTKHIGFPMGILLSGIFFLEACAQRNFRRFWVQLLSLLFVCLAIKVSWEHYIQSHGFFRVFSESSITDFAEILTGKAVDWKYRIPPYFWKSVWKSRCFIATIIAFFVWFVAHFRRENHQKLIRYLIYWVSSSTAYLYMILGAYLTSFNEWEASQLSSFDRYISPIFVGWSFFFIFSTVVRFSNDLKKRKNWAWATISFVLIFFLIRQDDRTNIGYEKMQELGPWAEKIEANVKPGEHIFFVYQNTTGREFWMFKYYAYPAKLSPIRDENIFWSFGPKYFSDDIWTQNFSLPAFHQKARDYDFVLLARPDDQFWKLYGSLFSSKIAGLYKWKNPENRVSLELID
jgi:hypothetical protein